MRLQLDRQEWNEVIERTELCAAGCHRRAVSTRFAVPFYERFGKVDILPIGVDCDLFQPQPENVRQATRLLSCVPNDARVGFWMGTNHRMKGSDRLVQYARDNPDIFWIVVWKSKRERGEAPVNSKEYVHVTQDVLAGLMACSDFLLATGRLRPWFMVEWEAMAAGLPVVDLSGLEREFAPSANPRQQVIELGWDRKTARETWLKYLGIQG
jgi:glycosyltransferase involved in cell wall biosynthesis